MTLSLVVEVVMAALLVLGGLFGLIGSWGLLRLPDAMQRLHAPTKATTIGVGTALIAANLAPLVTGGGFRVDAFLITLFVFVTAPLSAVMLAKANIARGEGRGMIPRPKGPGRWAHEAGESGSASPSKKVS